MCVRDWGPVVDAIGAGKQTILIRKAKPAHDDLLLLRTYTFTNERDFLSKHFQREFHEFVREGVEDRDSRRSSVNLFVRVCKVIHVDSTQLQILRRIEDSYIWTADHVVQHFQEEGGRDAFVWILRAYSLPNHAVAVPRGPMVYYHLETPILLKEMRPVIAETEFAKLLNHIESTLTQTIEESDPWQRIRELEGKVSELSSQLAEKDKRLQETSSIYPRPEPIDDVIAAITRSSEQGYLQLEWNVSRAFVELGFKSHWNGKLIDGRPVETAPKGHADVEVEAPLAGEPYEMLVEVTKVSDAAAQVTELSRAQVHTKSTPTKPQLTVFRILVAPKFTPQIEDICKTFTEPVNLIASTELARLLQFHQSIGGVTQEELRRLLDSKERGQIGPNDLAEWEDAVRDEREHLALLLDVYSVLFESADWITIDTIRHLLRRFKQRLEVTESDVQDAIRILRAPVIDAVAEKIQDGMMRYKASMNPQTFHMRIRKLDEEILKQHSENGREKAS